MKYCPETFQGVSKLIYADYHELDVLDFLDEKPSYEQNNDSQVVCKVCATSTNYPIAFKDMVHPTFSDYSKLKSRSLYVCPKCYVMYKSEKFWKKSWCAVRYSNTTYIYFGKLKEIGKFILNPPHDSIFYIYCSITRRKRGFIGQNFFCINPKENDYEKSKFFVCVDKYDDILYVDKNEVSYLYHIINRLINNGFNKTNLLVANYRFHHWQNSLEYGFYEDLKEAKKFQGTALWDLMVRVYE